MEHFHAVMVSLLLDNSWNRPLLNTAGSTQQCVLPELQTLALFSAQSFGFILCIKVSRRMSRVEVKMDASRIHDSFRLATHLLEWLLSRRRLVKAEPQRAALLTVRKAMIWLDHLFYKVDQFYSSSFLMRSGYEENKAQQFGITSPSWISFVW